METKEKEHQTKGDMERTTHHHQTFAIVRKVKETYNDLSK